MDNRQNLDRKKHKKNSAQQQPKARLNTVQKETGGPKGLEPTRYGDWEKQGRCIDF